MSGIVFFLINADNLDQKKLFLNTRTIIRIL